jgi:hypothetical protein
MQDLNVSGQIGAILGFLKLADKIDLLGSLCYITDMLRNILVTARSRLRGEIPCMRVKGWGASGPCQGHSTSDGLHTHFPTYCVDNNINQDPLRDNSITSEHLRMVFDLPAGHEARSILVNACVIPFLFTGPLQRGLTSTFKFEAELATIEGFSKELLNAVRKAIHLLALQANQNSFIIDPLDLTSIRI